MLFLSKLNLLQYNRKCSEHSFLYPHEQETRGTKFDLNKSLFRELHLFLSLACNTLRYRSPKRKVRRYSFRLKIFLLQFGFKRRKCRQLTKVQI
jgi:hypothetical protein